MLCGEYKHIENGEIIINTIPELLNTYNDVSDYHIYGNSIYYKNEYPYCDQCDLLEKRYKLYLEDPNHEEHDSYLFIRYLTSEENEKLEVQVIGRHDYVLDNETVSTINIPYGTYVMNKVN